MSRPSSPSGSKDTPGLAPHEAATGATLAASASPSPSPVPPTPPPKDALFPNTTREAHPSHLQSQSQSQPQSQFQSQSQSASTPTAAAMSKVGPKAAPPEEMDDPTELMVIDISGPPYDPDETIRVDSDADADGGHVHGEESPARESDVTDADITIVHPDVGRRSDSPEHGGSTLYGSGSGLGLGSGSGAGMDGEREREHEREREREHVQEHPLRLDVYPPSPPQWERDLESGDVDGEADLDLGRGGGGRASPQRFVFSSAKAQRVHEYGNGHGNGHGNGNGSRAKLSGRPRIPHSAYYFGPPPPDSAYGTEPCGQIGVHHPREVVRIERDYTGGELPQFMPTYPLELEGRITPTQFLETVNAINEILLSAHSLRHAFVDNALAYFSLQISRALVKTHYEKEMERLHALIDELNVQMYNPVGLHIRWPRSVAFLFLEIEYY